MRHFNAHCFGGKIHSIKIPTYDELMGHKGEVGKITVTTKKRKVYNKTGGLCYLCSEPVSFKDMTIDHVFPLCYGGTSALENLMPAHSKCNGLKRNKTLNQIMKDPNFKVITPF